jgi:hypothetical protein
MSQNYLFKASFHLLLIKIDQEFSNTIKQQGCPCGGQLHQSDYPRSPFGLPAQFRDQYNERFSFCCAICRKRITPQSVRFFGRRWFPAPLLLLISVLTLGVSKRRCAQVKRHLGITISESTWRRWRRWWSEVFITTPFWQQAKGSFPPTDQITQGPFPRVLLTAFQGKIKIEEKIHLLLKFLAPLTSGVLRAV